MFFIDPYNPRKLGFGLELTLRKLGLEMYFELPFILGFDPLVHPSLALPNCLQVIFFGFESHGQFPLK